MKKLFIYLVLLIFSPSVLLADSWCQWDGSQGINCQSDNKGYIRTPFKVSTEAVANDRGWFRVEVTQPAIGANQVKNAVVWDKVDNIITKTWTVRDLTATEIDQNVAAPMPLSEYYLWKALLVKGVITQQEAANALPQNLIDAYMARDRLENP